MHHPNNDVCPLCGRWLEPWLTDFNGRARCPICSPHGRRGVDLGTWPGRWDTIWGNR
jgi:hypothetical protein